MKRHFLFLLLITASVAQLQAQGTRYLVKLKDKGGSPFSFSTPNNYLSQRAIDRRDRYGIGIDSTDLPVTPSYVNQVAGISNVTVLNVSKWLNAISIQTSDVAAINSINNLPFVEGINLVAGKVFQSGKESLDDIESQESTLYPWAGRAAGTTENYFDYGNSSLAEIHIHNGEFLHNIGMRGQGMQIAMLDNGFYNYNLFTVFDSVNMNNQVRGTWDFINREQNVANDGSHGMSCFSTIGANLPGEFIGNAPKADFWLFKTEDDASEYEIEEFNWSCGAERADSSGADVISTSLGYTTFDQPLASTSHVYADMDGNTTMSSIAADLCAKKGILVFAANGNDGGNSWHYLGSPADGDSVVAVGAVSITGAVAGFSSFGPSADGQIKPDVAAVGAGAMIESAAGTVALSNGTSFSCPKMAGLGTCLWQAFPEFNNMKIVEALQKSGSIATAPDARIGYGIPNLKLAFGNLLTEFATSTASVNNCTVSLNWNSKDIASMSYEIERKTSTELNYTKIGILDPDPGTTLSNHQYLFADQLSAVPDGNTSYRIRQIIDTDPNNLAAFYIDTASVSVSGCADITASPDFFRVIPNPSGGPVNLEIQTILAISNMTISIYDMRGSLVIRLFESKGPGDLLVPMPVEKLLKGNYIIKISDGKKEIGTTNLLRL